MKANKIYLERLRKNYFVDRSPIWNNPMKYFSSKDFAEHLSNMSKNILRPKPNFPKGSVEYISEYLSNGSIFERIIT